MKVNFYREIENGFELIKSYTTIADDNNNRFVTNFKSVDLTKSEDYDTNRSAKARYDRRRTVYLCCLYRASFQPPQNFQVNFTANQDVRNDIDPNINPSQNLTLEQATNWWEMFWDIYDRDPNSTFSNIFRLQELIDEETGGDGILGYLMNVIEHLIIIHLIRQFLRVDSNWLKKILFIKDGLISFGGQPARLHRPMKDLVNWLFDDYNILLVGLEKSGAFVDRAQEIQNKLEPGQALVLTDDYIYRYIKPGGGDPDFPYAHTSNYGHKVIFKTRAGQMYVLSVPVRELKKSPPARDLPNLQVILNNIESLHCDMYDSALFPVALVNKLVSLSAHPSQRILQKFANSGSANGNAR